MSKAEKVAALKREHNALVLEGRPLLEKIEALASKVTELRDQINALDPDEHDEICLLFEGTYEELPQSSAA